MEILHLFFHYKSMEIFLDAQGQLTPQSLVRSGRITNSFEMLWMSSLPESIKKIRSTRIDVYETLCPQQMLVHKGGKIKNWGGGAEMSHLQNRCLKISG